MGLSSQPRLWVVTDGETIPQTVFVQTYVGRCKTCDLLALGHTTLGGVEAEMRDHYRKAHRSRVSGAGGSHGR